MELEQLERLVSGTDGNLKVAKQLLIQHMEDSDNNNITDDEPRRGSLEPTQALKIFFDRVAVCSIPGIKNDAVVEVKSGDSMKDAITHLYRQNVLGAPVRDEVFSESPMLKDRYVGLVDLASMVLWALQEFEVATHNEVPTYKQREAKVDSTRDLELNHEDLREVQKAEDCGSIGFFELLDKFESAKVTKIGALASSLHWGPFLPVNTEDTLLHILLLLSKHSLKAVPVVDSTNYLVRGFITQDLAARLLLQCDGLCWFDDIAQKTLSDFGFPVEHNTPEVIHVFGDEIVLNAMKCLWRNHISSVPVIERKTKSIMGHVRLMDVRLLLDKPQLFSARRTMTVLEFMEAEANARGSRTFATAPSFEEDFGASLSAAALSVGGSISLPRMSEPVTSRPNDSLKSTLEKIVYAMSDRSFLVDDKCNVTGVITLRDITRQFAPPTIKSPTKGDEFFSNSFVN